MSSQQVKQTRLMRQASVLHEIQESQEKDSLEGRYARLMAELSALCSDRSNVITADSLAFFATSGRAEPVKLEREPERVSGTDSLSKASGNSSTSKADDLLSADAARRQRVEELTRFFMEAKSDIEFKLGAGREFRDAAAKDRSSSDKDKDTETDDDREQGGNGSSGGDGDDDDTGDATGDSADPVKHRAQLHARLLTDTIDARVYSPMLAQVRETDAALYGAVLCHPLVTGVDPKKDKRNKKKKRKDRKDKSALADTAVATAAPSSSSSNAAAMLVPDFTSEPLGADALALHTSRFVARAIADGSLQALALAVKLVLATISATSGTNNDPSVMLFPLATHLRVLRGEKAPEFPVASAQPTAKSAASSTAASATASAVPPPPPPLPSASGIGRQNSGSSSHGDASSTTESSVSGVTGGATAASGTTTTGSSMDLDTDMNSLAKLRARLSRFGNDDDDDDDEDEDDDDDDDNDHDDESGSIGEEGVDEDALMARAIALSLSPELSLRDQSEHASPISIGDAAMSSEDAVKAKVVKPRPTKFSPDEMLELGPFELPDAAAPTELSVDGVTVALALLTHMNKLCLEYLTSCRKGVLPSNSPVQPHPLTFMLLNSVLLDLHTASLRAVTQQLLSAAATTASSKTFWRAKWELFLACALLSVFRVLEAHFFHIEVLGTAPASVGLGHIPALANASKASAASDDDDDDAAHDNNSSSADHNTTAPLSSTTGNPLLQSLKHLVTHYVEHDVAASVEPTAHDAVGAIIFVAPAECAPNDVAKVAALYATRVREQATGAWVRALAHFYPSQQERYSLLTTKLLECRRLARSNAAAATTTSASAAWPFCQLDLLCARLALPDMAQLFVPHCADVVEQTSAHTASPFSGSSSSSLVRAGDDNDAAQPIDDGVLQNAASKTGKIRAKWSPSVIRASLAAGSLTPRCLLEYISDHAPPGLVDAMNLTSAVAPDDARHADVLATAYEQMWDLGRKLERDALECITQLPPLVDLLRESVLTDTWPSFSFATHYELVHAPLLPILERRTEDSASASATQYARVLLLRSLQDLMVQRLGGSRGDELPALEFDPSRCAETMTLSDGNQTAKQYTAKQWGMVMATTGCPPNTGIHEWAVRLDRCEKGHIFLGVCTRDASVATYVGGDRQGWGLIGTRALWHNRSKVRGDYGDGFSTGSVVRVRLNTDSGALSFGIDDSDWGIAFDGLTQHGTLYPAIGLYQRDDQVTILPVASSSDELAFASARSGDAKGAKRVVVPAVLKPFLHHCSTLLESTCAFLQSEQLRTSLATVHGSHDARAPAQLIAQHPLVFALVLPLLSSVGLIKNYHGLGSILAMHFVPWSIKTMKCIENVNQALQHYAESTAPHDNSSGAATTTTPGASNELALSVAGEWELKSMAAGNIPAQQYHLTLTQTPDGAVTGRSSGSFTTVTLSGVVRGTKVSFLESWRQGGMCLVEGRLRADGRVFNGCYEDAKSHTSGNIVGTKIKDDVVSSLSAHRSRDDVATMNSLKILEMVAANLLGYFSHALMHVAKDDLFIENLYAASSSSSSTGDEELVNDGTSTVGRSGDDDDNDDDEQHDKTLTRSIECSSDDYDEWLRSTLLSGGLPPALVQTHLKSVLDGLSELTGFNRTASASGGASASSREPILAAACSQWLAFVSPKTLSASFPAAGSGTRSSDDTSTSFLTDLINNTGEAIVIDRWVSRHVGESPFVRLGGEPMKVARRTICAAMLWHSGFLSSIRKILDAPHANLIESEVRPHENLMHIWRAAQRVIEWAIRAKNSMESTYPVIAGLVIRKAQFLLEIEPSSRALAAASAVCVLSGTADFAVSSTGSNSSSSSGPGSSTSSGLPLASTKAVVYECAERIYSEVLMQISRFIEAPLRVSTLQSKLLGNAMRAFLRTIGLLSFRSFVGEASSSGAGRSALTAEPRDVIQSSYALSSALQWLSPSLLDHRGSAGAAAAAAASAAMKELNSDFNSELSALAGAGGHASPGDSSHYLSGLGGCGKHLRHDLRDAFESLYSYLSASLSRATWARDSDLQLVILQAWGIIIQPDDHAFLSRVSIFRVLQTVLDEARGSSPDPHALDNAAAMSLPLPPGTLDARALVLESKKKIVQAALKVVHLLAAQVAHAGDTADDVLSATDLPPTAAGLSLGAIPLLRKPSGPETLGKSVFHMLYTELKNSLDELRLSARRVESADVAAAAAEPTDASDPSLSTAEPDDSADRLNDASEYCYQICTLLYSVSGSPVCRSHLSSSRWLHLLLALVDVNAPLIQRRILKLLRRLLPSLDPSSIRVRYDEVESFEMDSDDDVDTETHDDDDGADHAASLIKFFVAIVGSISPPSVADVLFQRAASGQQQRTSPMDTGAVVAAAGGGVVTKSNVDSDLAAEVILLLRSLYESDKWTTYLNRAIADALAGIPESCITESSSASANSSSATDADVEMEDMSSSDVPSRAAWKAQSAGYLNALSALCVLDGHIEGLRVGGTVKIMPRAGSALQDIAFRGARGVVVAYEPEKAAAEVLLRGTSRNSDLTSQQSGALPTRPVRVPVDDLFPVPDVELPPNAFSDAVLQALLTHKLPYFLSEIQKSLVEIQAIDALAGAGDGAVPGDDSEDDDDDMSNDGMDVTGSTTSGGGGGGGDSEAESELLSPRFAKSTAGGAGSSSTNALGVEPSDIVSEMEKESRLFRMLLCQHGLRASATLVKDAHCAATLIRGAGATGLVNLLNVAISDSPTTAGVGDIASLEETWLLLWARWRAIRVAHAAPVPKPSATPNSAGNDASGANSSTSSLASGPMVQQMMEMGFPKEWCEVALARCSHNVEAAINFCFEHSSDMERLLAQYKASRESAAAGGIGGSSARSHRRDELDLISPLLEQLSEMGFPGNWCKKALAANRNNVDAALTWILSNGEALEAEDRREEEAKLRAAAATAGDEPSDEAVEHVDDSEERVLRPNPLRCVSGQACIGEDDLMVEGLVGGGFASVGAPDCLVSTGRWYYEATLHSNGCIQIGWADVAFSGSADRGDGVGDGSHSWAYDGWRQQKWHGQSSPWGSKWKQGDVVGCAIDADAGTIIFTLNGKLGSANMGIAFRAIKFARGVYPCASFNRRERLQFNLGGAPFKFAPPPGFAPILNVLAEHESGGLAALPKGFGVIGLREDCLEESLGDESYASDARFFPRDVHPSMLRGGAGSGRGGVGGASGLAAGSKADAIAEIKAIPDSRVYMELLLVTRALAILQARRMLLTLLAKWPSDVVGPFAVKAFLSSGVGAAAIQATTMSTAIDRNGSSGDATRFIDFVKLIAGLSGHVVLGANTSVSAIVPDSDAAHLLDCGVTGRYALSLLSSITQSALHAALASVCGATQAAQHDRSSSDTSTANNNDADPLVDAILACIAAEVKRASQRQYARIPWDASDAAITGSFLQITADAGHAWSDREVLNHPNLFLAEWFTRLMNDGLVAFKSQLPQAQHDRIRQQLLSAWITSLKSPSLGVKERGATILAGMFQEMLPRVDVSHATAGSSHDKHVLETALQALPLRRLVALTQERTRKEYANLPVGSKYLQSLTELVAVVALALDVVGKPTESLFDKDVVAQLAACKQVERDLYPLNLSEYEAVVEEKRVLQQKLDADAELKRQRDEADAAAASAAATDDATASTATDASSDSTSLTPADTIIGFRPMRTPPSARDDADTAENAAAATGGASNMEVDNSDSEESPDITLSAIANMVSEDSDVAAAAAAIAVAAHSRVAVKRQSKTKIPIDAPVKKEPAFEFVFPDEPVRVDESMLNADEKHQLDAAMHGIVGDELRGWRYGHDVGVLADTRTQLWSGTATQFRLVSDATQPDVPELTVGCKVIRGPNWKWRDQDGGEGSIGVVEGVSPWSGVDGEGMSVRWPNESLYTYRWGADGNFDLVHVDVDDSGKVVREYATPKTKHDDEGRFGSEVHLGVLLHVFDDNDAAPMSSNDAPRKVTGAMEWPDYGAEVYVVGLRYHDGSLCIQELQLTRGNPDMGWSLRFGTEKWQPGTRYLLRPVAPVTVTDGSDSSSRSAALSAVETLRGSYTHSGVKRGKSVSVQGEMVVTTRTLFTMDPHQHFSTLAIADNGLSVTCHAGESRNLALGTVGFTTGVHYWEVRVDQAEFGSVFIGVCEKAGPPGSQAALSSRLNRWHGWGFVNFRATYHNSTERIYGDHFNAGDTIGVKLDMEQGTLSFFMDGIKFGEHIVADLGVAFESIKGERGGAKTLYPCIGMRKSGDRVTLNEKWISAPGIAPQQLLVDAMDVSRALHAWYVAIHREKAASAAATTTSTATLSTPLTRIDLPTSLLEESWCDWKRWRENRWQRFPVRPRGMLVDFDTSPASCMRVSKAAGLDAPFLAGDRVRMCSKCGRELNQPEEAVILGVYRDLLWYRTETQGNEGADEGRAWGWYLAPSELGELLLIKRDGKDMTLFENSAMDVSASTTAPDAMPFAPRSDVEQRALLDFGAFAELATRAHSSASDMQLVERLNTFCAALGTDVTNLKINGVLAANEASTSSSSPPFIPDEYFATPALRPLTGAELRARVSVLRVLNNKLLRVLPMISIESAAASIDALSTAAATGSIDVVVDSTSAPLKRPQQSPVKFLSTSHKLRALRRLVFTSTKRAFWDDVLRATTTSTPLPSDEYEDPREIRVIRINRIQAQASKLSLLAQPGDRLRRSVFGQLYREMRTWSDSFFRRAYCGKGHGGQRRAFKVKFLGEGVNDYGGPYRAVFEQIVDELQTDNVELSKHEQGLLPLLVPCPNRRSGTGSNQDKFLLNPSCGTSGTSNGPMALDLHRFLGKVIGTAVRHGLQMGLDLPALVWRPLAGLDVTRAHLESVDVVTTNTLERIEASSGGNGESGDVDVLDDLRFTTPLSDGTEVPLVPNGAVVPVTPANRQRYVELVEATRLRESSQQLAALRDGLAAVLPMELAPLFTPRELEVLICGRREVDVALLQQCTEYSDGCDASMPHVGYFWEVLHELSSDDRTSFLRFVWARSRMPNSAKDFPMNFKLQSAHDPGARVDPDTYLPHAQTCFFALRLPTYSSKDVLRAKLLYAIQNSPNMDADVRLHNAEGWADA